MRQLALDLPWREALGRADFLVSESNRQAVQMIDAWPAWPHAELILLGPEGSGKSHLVEVWRARSGAALISAGDLTADRVPALSQNISLAVEDCGSGIDEIALFHLLNEMNSSQSQLLLTASKAPAAWSLTLQDLASRLNRMAVAALAPPDDALMEAVLVKLFADRQVDVPPSVIHYLVLRIERSFAAMRDVVARLDRLAIEEQCRVTRSLAARVVTGAARDRE